LTREYDEVVLTFPDGRLVGPGDLSEWLEAVDACEEFTQEDKDVAHAVVARIRALSN